jgi:Prophage CP4-57 regulatory protein (AlpA).
MKTLTFDELPGAIMEMNNKLDVLLAEYSSKPREDQDRLMTIEELRIYIPEQPARQTVYDWIFKRKIPNEKFGKRVYFRKSEIDTWLANGRQMA